MNCYIPQVDWISVCLLLQICKCDAIIRTTTIAMQQTAKKIDTVTACDYRSILVPLLKSFMRVCVEFSVLFCWRYSCSYLPTRLWFDVFGVLFPFCRYDWKIRPTKMQKRSMRLLKKHSYQNLNLMTRKRLTKEVVMQDKDRENQRIKRRKRIKEGPRN